MDIKITRSILPFAMILLVSIGGIAQVVSTNKSDSLLILLKQELFPVQSTNCYLFDYINWEAPKEVSIKNVLIRCNQPIPEVTVDLLEKIMLEGNTNILPDLERMYHKHFQLFWSEWSAIYKRYVNRSLEVAEATDQFRILMAFEQSIEHLRWEAKGLTLKEKYINFRNESEQFLELLHNSTKRCELVNKRNYVIDSLKLLQKCMLPRNRNNFSAYTPLLDQFAQHAISDMLACDLSNCSESRKRIECYMWSLFNLQISMISDDRIVAFYIKNYGGLKTCYRHTWAFRYAGQHEFEALTRFLILRYIEDYDPKDYYGYMTDLARSDFNLKIILEEVIKLHKRDPNLAKIIIKKLPYDRTLILLDKQRNSIGAKALIKHLDEFKH